MFIQNNPVTLFSAQETDEEASRKLLEANKSLLEEKVRTIHKSVLMQRLKCLQLSPVRALHLCLLSGSLTDHTSQEQKEHFQFSLRFLLRPPTPRKRGRQNVKANGQLHQPRRNQKRAPGVWGESCVRVKIRSSCYFNVP